MTITKTVTYSRIERIAYMLDESDIKSAIASRIEQAFGVKLGWISVQRQERPTRHSEQVWCYDEHEGIVTGYYYHGWRDSNGKQYDAWAMDGEYGLSAVTHWQPLIKPDPPLTTHPKPCYNGCVAEKSATAPDLPTG